MDIKSEINENLYAAIQRHYENSLYSDAVLNAFKYMTDCIRRKSGLGGDGASLIGTAFGGSSPPLKFNSMQTVSEADEHKGFEQILRGLYIAVRNPRSHEVHTDTKETCDAILIFLNYLIQRIESADTFFNLDEYKKKVFDPLFVTKDEYAELLVGEIPSSEMANVGATILAERSRGDPAKLQYFFRALFERLDQAEAQKLMVSFSRELEDLTADGDIINVVRLIKPELWPFIAEAVKFRIESCIIESIKQGKYDAYKGFSSGALGTWASGLSKYFTLKEELGGTLIGMLRTNWYTQNYVSKYFGWELADLITRDRQIDECCLNLCYAAFSNRARILRDDLLHQCRSYNKKWKESLLKHALIKESIIEKTLS